MELPVVREAEHHFDAVLPGALKDVVHGFESIRGEFSRSNLLSIDTTHQASEAESITASV